MVTFYGDTGERLYREAGQRYPEECCGVLLGERTPAGERIVREIRPQQNTVEASRRGQRFALSPWDLLEEERRAEAKGYEIVGFYHSHPDHGADASKTDVSFAVPDLSYPILSVIGGEVRGMRSYEKHITEQKEIFSEEEIRWQRF